MKKSLNKSSNRRRKTMRKTRTHRIKRTNKSHIISIFLEMLNMVKLYHWKTHSYAQHKATDELYERLNANIDKFVEILLGKDESRIQHIEKRLGPIDSIDKVDFKERIYEYRQFLTDFNMYLDEKKDTDLLNVRDEILGDINQFLYLMTFDK